MSIEFSQVCAWRLTLGSYRGRYPPLHMSNFYCHPGRSGSLAIRISCLLGVWLCVMTTCGAHARPVAMEFCTMDSDARPWILSEGDGLTVVLIKEVMQRLHMPVSFQRMPSSRCLHEVQSGRRPSAHLSASVVANAKLTMGQF
jgi:hypothetical protein